MGVEEHMHASFLRRLRRDHFAGGLIVLVGMSAVFYGRLYEIGTLKHMGPGFFPVAVGVILTLLGIAIAFTAPRATAPIAKREEPSRWEWRGWICILLGFVAFILLIKRGGMIPATTAIVMISAMAERDNKIVSALILALLMNLIVVVVFKWALQMPFPLFTWGN
jgi:hypothetical protein